MHADNEKQNQICADLRDVSRICGNSRQYEKDRLVLVPIVDALLYLVENTEAKKEGDK